MIEHMNLVVTRRTLNHPGVIEQQAVNRSMRPCITNGLTSIGRVHTLMQCGFGAEVKTTRLKPGWERESASREVV